MSIVPAGAVTVPEWWPEETRDCHDDLVAYRLVGASACADRITRALEALAATSEAEGRDVRSTLNEAGRTLCALKPDTALYLNVVEYLAAGHATAATVAERVSMLRAYRHDAQRRVVEQSVELLRAATTLLVHDYSSMVIRILDELGRQGPRHVVVTAGEPLGQGTRVARLVAEAGHDVTYVPDATVGRNAARIDAFVTGVETFYGDGSLANTVGTLSLALLCRHFDAHVIAPAECMKLHPRRHTVRGEELTARLLHPWPGPTEGVDPTWQVDDHVLDAVPGALITSYVTERGVASASEVGALARGVALPGRQDVTGAAGSALLGTRSGRPRTS